MAHFSKLLYEFSEMMALIFSTQHTMSAVLTIGLVLGQHSVRRGTIHISVLDELWFFHLLEDLQHSIDSCCVGGLTLIAIPFLDAETAYYTDSSSNGFLIYDLSFYFWKQIFLLFNPSSTVSLFPHFLSPPPTSLFLRST